MERRKPQIDIRNAEYDDLIRLCEIYSEAFRETEPSVYHWYTILQDKNQFYRVITVDGKVMGAANLLLINKILRSGSVMGLIEDVAVSQEARGLGLGKLLIEDLIALGWESGCYKIVLNCSDDNIAFYEKCGLHRAENQMRIDNPGKQK